MVLIERTEKMGQTALAVVYGVPMDGDLYNSLRSDPSDRYSELDNLCEDMETGSNGECLGVSVGTSIYAQDGERELDGVIPVADLPVFLAKQIKAAAKRWVKFSAEILKKKQVRLSDPQLLLVTVDRA
jgi:hypothetical protein